MLLARRRENGSPQASIRAADHPFQGRDLEAELAEHHPVRRGSAGRVEGDPLLDLRPALDAFVGEVKLVAAELARDAEIPVSAVERFHEGLELNGIVIVRDSAAHRASMTLSAEYLEQTAGAERDPFDWVPEFSRRGRGITVYAALRHLGRAGVESLVDRLCARARQMADLLRREPKARVLNDVVLNQVLVRFGDDDEMTRRVITRAQQDGTCWMAGTTWHGMAAMRISVSNWATSEKDVERSAEAIIRAVGS